MAYEHTTTRGTYTLHCREVELKGGRKQSIYFFARKGSTPTSGVPVDLPHGKEVAINERTGLPFLRNAGPISTAAQQVKHAAPSQAWQQAVATEQLAKEAELEAPPRIVTESSVDVKVAVNARVTESTLSDRPTATDLLGFEPYVVGLGRFLSSSETKPPLSVSIEGAWGQGKSSFLKQLDAQIQQEDPEAVVFWFNPWRHQTMASLWASFAKTALDAVISSATNQTRRRENRRRWWQATKPKVPLLGATILGSSAAAAGAYVMLDSLPQAVQNLGAGSLPVASILAVGSKRLANLNRPVQWSIEEHITNEYAGYVDFQATFNDSFSSILDKYSEGRRIYALIDDLDRCSPEQSAHLMEAMHHLTADNSKIIFVLGIDYDKVAAGLGHQHLEGLGAKSLAWPEYSKTSIQTGRHFLEKLIQLRFIVPIAGAGQLKKLAGGPVPPTTTTSEHEAAASTDAIEEEASAEPRGVPEESEFVITEIQRVSPHLDFNPRRVLHFLNAFRLQCALARELRLFDDGIRPSQIATWTVLTMRHPFAVRTILDDPDLLQWMTEIADTDQATADDVPENIRELLRDRSLAKLLTSHDALGPQEGFRQDFVNRIARLNVRDSSDAADADDAAPITA